MVDPFWLWIQELMHHTLVQLQQYIPNLILFAKPFYLNMLKIKKYKFIPPIETWSSILADVGTVSTHDGWHNTLFSDTKAAQVY